MTQDNAKPYVDPNPTIVMQETPTDSPTDSPSYPWEMDNVTFYGLRNPDPYRQHERILFIMHNKAQSDVPVSYDNDPPVSIWKVNHHDGETYFNRKQYDSVSPSRARTVWDDAVNQRWVRDDSIPPRMREGIKAMKMDLKTTSTNYALEA